jgi:hypothetical protein
VAMAQPSRSSAGELLGLRLLVSVMGDPSLSVYRLLTLSVYIHNPDWVKRLEMRASKKVFRVLQPSLSTAVGAASYGVVSVIVDFSTVGKVSIQQVALLISGLTTNAPCWIGDTK